MFRENREVLQANSRNPRTAAKAKFVGEIKLAKCSVQMALLLLLGDLPACQEKEKQ